MHPGRTKGKSSCINILYRLFAVELPAQLLSGVVYGMRRDNAAKCKRDSCVDVDMVSDNHLRI